MTEASSEALIDIAAGVIVARGYASTSLGDVAGAAGVTTDDVVNAFDRKDCLVTAIVDRAAALFTLPFDARFAAASDRALVEALLDRQLALVDDNREVFLVALLRLLRPADYPAHVPPLTSGLSRLEHYMTRFDDWIEGTLETSRDEPTVLTGHAAGGAVVGTLARWASRGGVDRAAAWSRPLASMLVR